MLEKAQNHLRLFYSWLTSSKLFDGYLLPTKKELHCCNSLIFLALPQGLEPWTL